MQINFEENEAKVLLELLEGLKNRDTTASLEKEKLSLESIFENSKVDDKSNIYIALDNIVKKINYENEKLKI